MKKDKRIISGIIGCGEIGKMHIKNILTNVPYVKIKSVCDMDVGKIKKWAKDLGIENIFSDYKKIINDPEIDTVLIFTPTDTHVDLIIEAANAGKDIFCEKPIGLDVRRIKDAVEVVKESGVKLQIGFMKRFDQNYKKIRKMIDEGKIGDQRIIMDISRDYEGPSPDYIKTCGGLFRDNTCHDFDLVRYLTGSEIGEIYAAATVLTDKYYSDAGYFDTALITLKFQNGAIGVIDNAMKTTYGYDQRVEVFGSKGSAVVDNVIPAPVELSNNEGIIGDKPSVDPYFFIKRYLNAYIEEIRQFFDAVLNNKKISVNGIDGLKNILICIAAEKSVELNKPVKVDYSLCE